MFKQTLKKLFRSHFQLRRPLFRGLVRIADTAYIRLAVYEGKTLEPRQQAAPRSFTIGTVKCGNLFICALLAKRVEYG
jgi:hypothetical protein